MRDIYITLMGPCCWAGLGGCLAIRVGLGRSLTHGLAFANRVNL